MSETLKELHNALEPETLLEHFSLEQHGPLYVLSAGLEGQEEALNALGLQPKDQGLFHTSPEWIEKMELGQHHYWRIGVMPDNDYLFQVILPVNGFGPDFEQWLEEQYSGETFED